VDQLRPGAAEVAVVPGLIRIAGHSRLAARIAHHEAVLPGVRRQPATRGRGREIAVVPGRRGRGGAPEVHGRSQLMLGVAGTGRDLACLCHPDQVHPVGIDGPLRVIAAVGRLDREAGARASGSRRHRTQVVDHQRPDAVAAVQPGDARGAQVARRIRGRDPVDGVHEGLSPLDVGGVGGAQVRVAAGRQPRSGQHRARGDDRAEGELERDDDEQCAEATSGHAVPLPTATRAAVQARSIYPEAGPA
jgi:hypothetical protein